MKEGRKDFWVQKTGGVYLIKLSFGFISKVGFFVYKHTVMV